MGTANMITEIMKSRGTRGFTIIELLIVIVVIGILAAITVVAYTGITTNANTNSAKSSAQAIARKIHAYSVEVARYPVSAAELSADATKAYYIKASPTSFDPLSAQPSNAGLVRFIKCGTTPFATQADITTANITGIRLHYWTYTGSPNATSYVSIGNDAGAGVSCPAS